jgi:hypothetical protein
MLRSLPLVALVLLLAAPAAAQLSFGSPTHDFGEIEEGVQARHTFVLSNEGTAPLTIRSVRPSCGCTAPTFTTEAIAPGETGEIVVVFDSEGRPGPFRKSIYVSADAGGELVEQTLYITGRVEQETLAAGVPQGNVLFDADAFDFGTVEGSRSVTHVFKMQHTGQRPIRITEVRVQPEGLDVAVPTTPVFAGDLVDIRATVPAEAVAGPFDYAIVLVTDDEAQPAKSLRLTGVGVTSATQ